MEIRPVLSSDLESIVKIHAKAFPNFFMTSLGPKFIKEYYNIVLNYPKRVFLVAEEKNIILGFVAGFAEPKNFYSQLRGKKIKLGLSALPAVLKKPALITKIFNNLNRVNKLSLADRIRYCELASIAVDPDHMNRGLGKSLVHAFLKMSKDLGAEVVYLTTDADNNDKVNNFYKSLGFKLNNTFLAYSGRLMNEYVFYLNQNESFK